MMAQYPDVFIMTFSIHIPNFVLLSQTAQLLLIFCYAAPLLYYKSVCKSSTAALKENFTTADGLHHLEVVYLQTKRT